MTKWARRFVFFGVTLTASARADEPEAGAPETGAPEAGAPAGVLVGESPQPLGAASLKRARAAWSGNDMGSAEAFYREAIAKGGLAPDEVLEGYVRLGTARLLLGRKEQSLAAFRAAAVIDNAFETPPEAGAKGEQLALGAKKDMAGVGTLVVGISSPAQVKGGQPFSVRAKIDDSHSRIITRVALLARDGSSGKELYLISPPATVVDFEIPGSSVLPGSTLVLRVDAVDSHDNRLASAESRVEVAGAPVVVVLPKKPTHEPARKKEGSFFSSPWPYVLGGALLAGAGATIFMLTRPTDDVTIGTVGVRTR